jgi:hypothetical protein
MEPERRNKIVLAVLAVVLAGAGYRAWTSQSGDTAPASNGSPGQAAPARRGAGPPAIGSTDVHLKALDAERPKPAEGSRNLFRFKPKPPPPAPPPPKVVAAPPPPPPPPPPPVPTGPPPPPPPPPIVLKFIGMVQSADKSQRLAVLSDGRGGIPMYGKEGDIIEGRYRILRIGAESIEMAYLDGRGRQTIRLSGG